MEPYVFPLLARKQYPDWQIEFEAVALEADLRKLPKLLKAAETAMLLRQQVLSHSSDGYAECCAIRNAFQSLSRFKARAA